MKARLLELALAHPATGFEGMLRPLRRAGFGDNHKRVRRVYRALQLPLARKRPRRRQFGLQPQPKEAGLRPNACWSQDFVSDSTRSGRKLRALTVLDDHTRRALCIEVDSSLPTRRVTLALERAMETYGKPAMLRTDNGPEFRDRFAHWCAQHNIHLHRIAPGKPTQNALIERFTAPTDAKCWTHMCLKTCTTPAC
ncbi:MAG: DDE-type integrase/transposase/recombinase [Sphingobacteriia bacterium]